MGGMPTLTVSLVTHNGLRWLPGCLRSLREQTQTDFELLVLDNASTDGTREWLAEAQAGESRMTLELNDANLGFAAAHNRNIARARGELVCLLNQDVVLDAGYLQAAAAAFADRPRVSAVQGRLRRLASDGTRLDTLDTTGLVMHRSRRVTSRHQGHVDGRRFATPGPVWGVDGPAPVYRRAALLSVVEPRTGGGEEVLDEDFFMYKEDVDLAWRLRRAGWATLYEPAAIAWHARGAGAPSGSSLIDLARSNRAIAPWIKALSWRNHRLMLAKNEDVSSLARDLPWIAARELPSLAFMAAADPARLMAVPRLLAALPAALRKRRPSPQPRRRLADAHRQPTKPASARSSSPPPTSATMSGTESPSP